MVSKTEIDTVGKHYTVKVTSHCYRRGNLVDAVHQTLVEIRSFKIRQIFYILSVINCLLVVPNLTVNCIEMTLEKFLAKIFNRKIHQANFRIFKKFLYQSIPSQGGNP